MDCLFVFFLYYRIGMLTVPSQQQAHYFVAKNYQCYCMSFPLDGNEEALGAFEVRFGASVPKATPKLRA